MDGVKWTDAVSSIAMSLSALLSIASVVAVFLVWEQLKQNRRQLELSTTELVQTKNIAQLQFEDALEKEYRELVVKIPTKALLDSDLDEDEYHEVFDEFFRYFDLSNRQVALRMNDRIQDETWNNWQAGIRFNLSLLSFNRAWAEIENRTGERADGFFSELRNFEDSKFADPKSRKR